MAWNERDDWGWGSHRGSPGRWSQGWTHCVHMHASLLTSVRDAVQVLSAVLSDECLGPIGSKASVVLEVAVILS